MRNRAGDNKFGFDLTHAHRLNSRAVLTWPSRSIVSRAGSGNKWKSSPRLH